jgi:hypothetical protein
MKSVRSGSHLEVIGGTFYFRRSVPLDAREAFGKSVVRISLHTSSLTEAKRLEKQHDVAFESRLQAARSPGPDERLLQLSEKIFNETLPDWWEPGRFWSRREEELANLPLSERRAVDQTLQAKDIRAKLVHGELHGLWPRLRELLFLSQWEEPRPCDDMAQELVELVRTYAKNRSEFTIDWAYEQWRKAKHRPQQTQDEARRYIEDFKKFTHLRTLTSIKRKYVTQWRDSLREAGDLAPKTINHRLEIVSAILRVGWREAEITAPPDLGWIKLPVPASNGRGSWSRDELLRALAALEPRSWSAWVFVIGLTTSTRIGEPIAAVKEWYEASTGCISVPAPFTKMKKPHALPIIELIREPLVEHISTLPPGAYMFNAPRPANAKLKIGHEASKWYGRFFDRHKIEKRVFHELRDTWIDAARKSTAKRDLWEIISGHSPRTGSDPYGGEIPHALMGANEEVCRQLLDREMTIAVRRLVD